MQQEAAEAQAASAAAAAAAVAAQQNAAVAYQTDGKAQSDYNIFYQHIFNAYFCQPWVKKTQQFSLSSGHEGWVLAASHRGRGHGAETGDHRRVAGRESG